MLPPHPGVPSTRQSSGKHPRGLVTVGLATAQAWSPGGGVQAREENGQEFSQPAGPNPQPQCKCPWVLAQLFRSQGRVGLSVSVATCPAVPIFGVFRHICKCVFVPVCRVGVGAKAAQGPCFSDWAWGRGRAACQPPLWGTVKVLGAPGCVAPALGSVWGPGLGHVLVGRPGGWDACPKCGPGLCQMESSRTSVLLAEGTDGKWCSVIGRDLLHTHTPCVCTHHTHKHIRVDTPWLQHWLPWWQELTLAQLCVAVRPVTAASQLCPWLWLWRHRWAHLPHVPECAQGKWRGHLP